MEAVVKKNKIYVSTINKPEPSTEMTEEEFDAKIQRAREQYARGEYTIYKNREEFDKSLGV